MAAAEVAAKVLPCCPGCECACLPLLCDEVSASVRAKLRELDLATLQTRCQEMLDAKVLPCCWPSCEFTCLSQRS